MMQPRGLGETLASLRRRLASVRVDAADRDERPVCLDRAAWLKAGERVSAVGLARGVEVVAELDDGSTWVGGVAHVGERDLELDLWGGPLLIVGRARVRRLAVVRPHGWRDRREVCRRQARGEPATFRSLRKKVSTE
jgi:hypothetical protein